MSQIVHRGKRAQFLGLVLCIASGAAHAGTDGEVSRAKRPSYVPGEIVVALKPGHVSGSALGRSMRNLRRLGVAANGAGFYRVKLAAGETVADAVATYARNSAVASVAPNYLNYPQAYTHDPFFAQAAAHPLWAWENTRQVIAAPTYNVNNPGTLDSDMDVTEAWVFGGAREVRVAVIDTGVDYTHPELRAAMWDARGATFGGAPRPSEFFGFDFADGDSDPYPVNDNHGTHVAGIVAASGDNDFGFAGIAYGAQIMALKIFPDHGGGATNADLIAALNYAVENGADIVNLSIGGRGGEDPVLSAAIASAVNAGVLLVAAAGNDGRDNDNEPMWPANYAAASDGVLAVLASDQADQRASFSNYGINSVSIAAPGVNVLSTVTGRALLQQERGDYLANGDGRDCAVDAHNCFNFTEFDAGYLDDCGGMRCRWGWRKQGGVTFVRADAGALWGNYSANLQGVIKTKAINTLGAQRLVLRYTASWDLECDGDYVEVEVYDGNAWRVLNAPAFNLDEAMRAPCRSVHTHTGRMAPVFGAQNIAYDISAYSNRDLRVRFNFVTNGAVGHSSVPGGFALWDLRIDAKAYDYTYAYEMKNGTSMAAPMVAGVAALVKSTHPGYRAAELKRAVLAHGDRVGTLANYVRGGARANAYSARIDVGLSALSPSRVAVGASAFTLSVYGRNFTPDAKVYWNGRARATAYVSANELSAVVSADDVSQAGSAQLWVETPNPEARSNTQTLSIDGSGGLDEGGGCTLARNDRFDPTLMLLLATIWYWRRRERDPS